jgi:hypothetical protein
MIDENEYIVTILRHIHLPYVFMIVAVNMKLGQEFVLELRQRDMLILLNGDT